MWTEKLHGSISQTVQQLMQPLLGGDMAFIE